MEDQLSIADQIMVTFVKILEEYQVEESELAQHIDLFLQNNATILKGGLDTSNLNIDENTVDDGDSSVDGRQPQLPRQGKQNPVRQQIAGRIGKGNQNAIKVNDQSKRYKKSREVYNIPVDDNKPPVKKIRRKRASSP